MAGAPIVRPNRVTRRGAAQVMGRRLESEGHLASRERGDLTLASGYSNGNVGYLCTASAIPEGGYEPAGSYLWYLRPGPFAQEVESTLIATALALARQLGPGPPVAT